jgi:hypothetical protein
MQQLKSKSGARRLNHEATLTTTDSEASRSTEPQGFDCRERVETNSRGPLDRYNARPRLFRCGTLL